jgi:hypothetical protein
VHSKREDLPDENYQFLSTNKEILDFQSLAEFVENEKLEYMTAHSRLCFAIIARIYRRVKMGYRFGPIRVSAGEMIVDGNHRYIAYKLAGIEFDTIEATRSRCDDLKNFNTVVIDFEHDWDANNSKTRKYCNDDFLNKEEFS